MLYIRRGLHSVYIKGSKIKFYVVRDYESQQSIFTVMLHTKC